MPEQKIYFQWQNPELEKTIYPLRRMKLRPVLEYYAEIDLWAKYKGRKIEDLADAVRDYHTKKAAVIQKALQDYSMSNSSSANAASKSMDLRALLMVRSGAGTTHGDVHDEGAQRSGGDPSDAIRRLRLRGNDCLGALARGLGADALGWTPFLGSGRLMGFRVGAVACLAADELAL